MELLQDYSGEFDPNLGFEKLSRDALIRLLEAYAKLFGAADGFWYLAVKEKFGNEAALDCDIKVWERGVKYQLDKTTRALNVQGNDVVSLMKGFQIDPWLQLSKYTVEVHNKDHAVLTITDCPTLSSLEREGEGREETICRVVEPIVFRKYAEYFDPNIEVQAVKLPPRKSTDEICCQWAFTLKTGAGQG